MVEPAGEDDGSRMDLCPPDVAAELAKVRLGGKTDPAFPFRLTSRRQLESMNSAYSNSSKTRLRYPVNPAFMNPQDMEEKGISSGDIVEISSAHGTVIAVAQRDPGLLRGVVSMTHAWGALDPAADPEGAKGAFVGRLVSLEAHLQPINYMPRQSAIPIAVRPHGQGRAMAPPATLQRGVLTSHIIGSQTTGNVTGCLCVQPVILGGVFSVGSHRKFGRSSIRCST